MAEGQFDIGEAFDALVGDEAPTPETPTPESTEISEAFDAIEAEGVMRDEKGRFAPKEPKAEVEPVAEPDAKAEVAAEATAEPEPEAPAIERPTHLSAKLAAHWDDLKPDVQAAIAEREREVHESITRVDRERQVGRFFDQTAVEYKDIIDTDGGGKAEVAVRNLLHTARMLRTGDAATKAQLVNQICAMYDIDIEQAYYQRPAPEVAQAQLQTQKYESELAVYKAREAQEQTAQMEAQNAELFQTVAQFRLANPLFDQVQDEMARLATAGVSQDLSTLYNMAIAANENLRSANAQQATTAAQAAGRRYCFIGATGNGRFGSTCRLNG